MNPGKEGSIKENDIGEVAVYLQEHSEQLAGDILDKVILNLQLNLTSEDIKIHQTNFTKLIKQIGTALLRSTKEFELNYGNYDEKDYFFKRGIALKETVAIITEFRLVLFDKIKDVMLAEEVDKEDIFFVWRSITETFDNTLRETTESFTFLRDEILKESMNELSAPIVPVQQGKAVLPLIGHIDTYRANHIMHTVIPKVVDLRVEYLIIDFSGIQVIDTFVTNYLFKITSVLRLQGIQAIITGINPFLAETAVRIGIDLSDFKTYATVQQALESIENK